MTPKERAKHELFGRLQGGVKAIEDASTGDPVIDALAPGKRAKVAKQAKSLVNSLIKRWKLEADEYELDE